MLAESGRVAAAGPPGAGVPSAGWWLGPPGRIGTAMAAEWTGRVRLVSAPFVTVARVTLEALHRSVCVGVVPDAVLPFPGFRSVGFEDQLAQVASLSADELVGALAAAGLLESGPWVAVGASPRRWLDGYLIALERVWAGVEPRWRRAAPLVEREIERVGVALVRGAFDGLLAGIDGRAGTAAIAPAPQLALIPMIGGTAGLGEIAGAGETAMGGTSARARHDDGAARMDGLAYLLPGADRRDGAAGPRPSGLDALIGAPRAEILRRLDVTQSAGQMARAMGYSPSVITHHLTALERAGLVARHRHGRQVHVERSPRGTGLLRLYE